MEPRKSSNDAFLNFYPILEIHPTFRGLSLNNDTELNIPSLDIT